MGTRFEIVLPDSPRGPSGARLRAAGEAAIDEIETWHRRLNRFAPDSLVSHLNRGLTSPLPLDRDTFDLFDDALAVWRDSWGAFDITVTPELVRRGAAESAVPSLCRPLGCHAIELDRARCTIWWRGEGPSIDLGGIAKGHALDCAAARLREAAVPSALLHGGTSSVIAIGRPHARTGWRVALGSGAGAPVVCLEDVALSLSDPDSQLTDTGRVHIVDPRVERPAAVRTGPVVVIGRSARLADAWSTALAVIGHIPGAFPPAYVARFLGRAGAPVPLGPAHADASI